ncbi:hypothetical protein [Haliangium sp. UPWRP_2]|uniref:hypothetical protein n=1 Tax=Haliangium sp. UPWRP_2 TaxID=1931276 RepID=UPI000D0CA615|nr:hypothetical protein [Haliangium sp. UPWRP_2]PSM31402.1 hypothetical protein BVG81_005595 [Haliangium sp. UPWRP_2]
MNRLLSISGLMLCLAGCGASDASVYSCDERTAATMPQQYCQEYAGLSSQALVDPYKAACPGTWGASACSHTGSLGGCRAAPVAGITITNWFYPDSAQGLNTSADVMTRCAQGSNPGTFVAP